MFWGGLASTVGGRWRVRIAVLVGAWVTAASCGGTTAGDSSAGSSAGDASDARGSQTASSTAGIGDPTGTGGGSGGLLIGAVPGGTAGIAGSGGVGGVAGSAGSAGAVCRAPAEYQQMRAEDLLATREEHVGARVAVVSYVTSGDSMCSLADCTDADPCCNWCVGGLNATAIGMDFGSCSGTDCDWMQNCNPPLLPGEHLLWGVVEQLSSWTFWLALDGYCP